ncbi:hypothetical protein M422DRAFT_238929 [Sphaerobolus stellatus SS14]|nr:hypothetical protein M422DRAFT_238929 [Sphaerobolus stellatus SS14]
MKEFFQKYKDLGSVWTQKTESIINFQVNQIQKGCLQYHHPDLPSHTSGNENWHKQLNGLTKGHASSLLMIIALITNTVLWFNLHITPNGLFQSLDSPSQLLLKAMKCCHHLFLIDNVLQKMEELTGIGQPKFINVCPEHHFGLLEEEYGGSASEQYRKLKAELKLGLKEEDCEKEEWLYLWETTLNGCLDELQILEQENIAVLFSSKTARFSSDVITSHKCKSVMVSELSAQPEDLFIHDRKRVEELSMTAVGEDESPQGLTVGDLMDPHQLSVDPQQTTEVFTPEHLGDQNVRAHSPQTVPVQARLYQYRYSHPLAWQVLLGIISGSDSGHNLSEAPDESDCVSPDEGGRLHKEYADLMNLKENGEIVLVEAMEATE